MKTQIVKRTGNIRYNNSTLGAPLEEELQRMAKSKEPLSLNAVLLEAVNETSEEVESEDNWSVPPESDIRTDRFEVMREKVSKEMKMKHEGLAAGSAGQGEGVGGSGGAPEA